MMQATLLTQADLNIRTISFDNIKAVFTKVANRIYDVILEINSHKFLIRMENNGTEIENFEVIAVKGFLDLSRKSIQTIRKLLQHLLYRLD